MLHYDLVSPNRLWPHYRIFLGTSAILVKTVMLALDL